MDFISGGSVEQKRTLMPFDTKLLETEICFLCRLWKESSLHNKHTDFFQFEVFFFIQQWL